MPVNAPAIHPRLLKAGAALNANQIPEAEALLREHLKERPTDVAAIRMLAEVAGRIGRYGDAESLLARCLELAPDFTMARYNYAFVLHRQYKALEAMSEIQSLLAKDPRNPSYRTLKAAILTRIGEYAGAIALYDGVLAEFPRHAKAWMSYGHALKTANRQAESIAAYRRSIGLAGNLGEAYWSLANLKTVGFAPDDLDAMRAQLARTDLSDEDRYHFDFALGKALEDAGQYSESFDHYLAGNSRRRATLYYDASETTRHVTRSRALFTRDFFAARAGFGSQSQDPIFIIGLPRAGSTLLEQILSSHPLIEGTMELPDITSIARDLKGKDARYPGSLAALTEAECLELGERYLRQTRIQRKTSAPFFIDKMPNNFVHLGLIHLILPRARIIDARRHPMACCFSAFKQHFARGQNFTYSLEDLGRYYADYVDLMEHFDAVLPGRVHRVLYERLIDDPPSEIKRLLNYCGVPFDAACLSFHANDRAVRTASSEQVRQPIHRGGLDQWRNYERWLAPLKNSLGRAYTAWNSDTPRAEKFNDT